MKHQYIITLFSFVSLLSGLIACQSSGGKQKEEHGIQIPNEQFVEYMKPYLNKGFLVRMVPKGNSMLPTLKNGEEVVTLQHAKEVKPGDIVLALTSLGHYVIHRVVKVSGQQVTLKGDHNKTTETASSSNVLAKLVKVEPIDAISDEASVQRINGKAKYHANPLYRIDRQDSLAWMVDTIGKRIDMHRIVVFNETALYLWRELENKEFTLYDMLTTLTDSYEVDSLRAFNDCRRLLKEWVGCELVVLAGK